MANKETKGKQGKMSKREAVRDKRRQEQKRRRLLFVLAIVGGAKDVEIDHCGFFKCNFVGILLINVGQVQVKNTQVRKTEAADIPGLSVPIGDGLLALRDTPGSFIEIDNCLFRDCARALCSYCFACLPLRLMSGMAIQ